jgi:hypothetical protein
MREHSTYRSERRNEWRVVGGPWSHFNRHESADKFSIGTWPHDYRPDRGSRSKYQPHIGKKERGRYAAA